MATPPSSLNERQTGQAQVYSVERAVIPPRECCVGGFIYRIRRQGRRRRWGRTRSAGAAQAHVGFPADDEVVRIQLLLGRGDAVLLLGPPAWSLDGTGYELALGIEPRELQTHALRADAELCRQGLDAPGGGVGRHELEHALAQRQACHECTAPTCPIWPCRQARRCSRRSAGPRPRRPPSPLCGRVLRAGG